jgi:fructose-bisphosphate aldolase, class II
MDLIPMFPILEGTMGRGYAQGAFNVTSAQQVKAALEIHDALRSPAVLEVGSIALGYLGEAADMNKSTLEERRRGARNAVAMVRGMQGAVSIPVALHADHTKDLETIWMLMDEGFTSVMIDASDRKFEDNIEITREVVKRAHARGVTVEAELGVIAGVEDDIFAKSSTTYTNPIKAVEFLKKTGADCLALSYGTKHGVRKGTNVKLRKEIVVATMENLRHERIKAVLVSHGSSTVPAYAVEDFIKLGGKLAEAGGIPLEELREVIRCGISKVNIDTDQRICVTRNIREFLLASPARSSDPVLAEIWSLMEQNPGEIDFRLFLHPIRRLLLDRSARPEGAVRDLIACMERGITEIVAALVVQFGSVGRANRIARTSLEEMAAAYRETGT